MIDVEQTIISQYGNSAIITQLIQDMNQYIDPRADIDTFFDFVFNVDTAQGFGLDDWGRIVNVSRDLTIPIPGDTFGFDEAGSSAQPFDQAPFYNANTASQTYILDDDAYRQLILVKALQNISAVNAPTLNQLLQNLFAGRGRCYVNDLGGMAMRYTFEFTLTPVEYAILTQSTAVARPAGVQINVATFEFPLFGFAEAGSSASPFDEGVFIP